MTLGEKLKELRKAQKLSQREVGACVNQDSAYISNVENGRKRLSENHIAAIALLLKTTEEELKTFWLADKVRKLVQYAPNVTQVLQVAEEQVEYHKKKKP